MPICPKCKNEFQVKGRSTPQNKSYWKLIIEPFAEYLALDRDKVHEMLKYKFLKEVRYASNRKGIMEEYVITRSTTSLSTKEFEEFCSQIRIWASSLGLYLYEPNEVINTP